MERITPRTQDSFIENAIPDIVQRELLFKSLPDDSENDTEWIDNSKNISDVKLNIDDEKKIADYCKNNNFKID